jgi:hypothetical protein
LASPVFAFLVSAVPVPGSAKAKVQGSREGGKKTTQASPASAGSAARSAEAEVRNSKEGGQNITKTMPDSALPAQIISSPLGITSTPVRVSAQEANGNLDLASSNLDEGGDPKHQGTEVDHVPVQTPVGQKGKARCKYRSKGRSPAKFTGTTIVVEGEGGNEGTREDEGPRVEAYNKDDDF